MLEEMEKANQNLYLSTYWINLTSAWMLSNTSEQDHNSSPCEHLPSGLLWMERYCKFWISHLGNCSFCTLHVLPMINPFAPYVFRGKNMIVSPFSPHTRPKEYNLNVLRYHANVHSNCLIEKRRIPKIFYYTLNKTEIF